MYSMFLLIYLNKDHKGWGHDLVKQLDLGASDGKHSLKVSSVNQYYLTIQIFLFPAGQKLGFVSGYCIIPDVVPTTKTKTR